MIHRHRLTRKLLQVFGFVLMALVFLGWGLPVQAVTVSPKLEEQILEVLRKHPEVILDSVQAYQSKQEAVFQARRQETLTKLQQNPSLGVAGSPVIGADDQKIVLVEFSDFQCPYCSEAYKTVKQLVEKHPEVTLVYKHYPLTQIHTQALPAARAAWAAKQQGKFWPYYDVLFSHQDKLGDDFYLATAKSLNLDLEQFNRDRNGLESAAAISEDMDLADQLGIQGTPFFVLNGTVLSGSVPLKDFEAQIAKIKSEVPAA